MPQDKIIQKLAQNRAVFQSLLEGLSSEEYQWKVTPEKWNLLEVICHLRDEEVEDFRTRVKCTLETPGTPPPPINPAQWVSDRQYVQQDYSEVLQHFLAERTHSIQWLQSLGAAPWDNGFQHQSMGFLTAGFFLTNWLAHDYLHIRQITRLKYDYLQFLQPEISIDYAGNWI